MDNSDVVPGEVKIQSQTPSGPLSLTLEAKQPIRSGNLIHKLAARAWIRDLEETRTRPGFEEFEKLVTALGLKYGLSSMFTSFVAVDQSGNTVHETMETRRIASQIPFGWGGFSQPIMMCSAPMMFGSMPMPLRGGGSGPDPAMDQDDMLCCNEMAPMPPPSGRAFSRKSAKMPEHEKNKKGSMKMNRKNKSESDEEAEGELTEAQKLQVIVDTQKFNGSFPINNSRLLQLFGLKDEKEVVEGAKTLNLSAEVYITLLSMEYLKSHLASFEEEWKLMAKKTEAWILQQKGITEEIRAKIKIDLQKKLGVQ
ncbi:unnamed protein product [Cyprideis torosa]|uniref:Uncharacterized protein n=1 Tax=Cyprideis torosa TaxID=163714 RepID=A0A7R8WQY6_9CRUS|nr:unnamed protein product [Cyprideis torosa]CAG0903215.1 unnamed protein product [Cyprideis torosa]